jgi:hypothetical protein
MAANNDDEADRGSLNRLAAQPRPLAGMIGHQNRGRVPAPKRFGSEFFNGIGRIQPVGRLAVCGQ